MYATRIETVQGLPSLLQLRQLNIGCCRTSKYAACCMLSLETVSEVLEHFSMQLSKHAACFNLALRDAATAKWEHCHACTSLQPTKKWVIATMVQ